MALVVPADLWAPDGSSGGAGITFRCVPTNEATGVKE